MDGLSPYIYVTAYLIDFKGDFILDWSAFFNDEGRTISWKTSRKRVNAGDLAETVDGRGYLQVGLNGRIYRVHRVLWEMRNGPIPPGYFIDHKNGIRTDNRPENLRLVTVSQNAMNARLSKRSSTGIKGVSYDSSRKKFMGQLCVKGQRHVEYFSLQEDAANWVKNLRETLHKEFANHGTYPLHR